MRVKLPTEHHLEFLSLKGGCTGSSKSTFVKMPHCWKSGVMAIITSTISSTFQTASLFFWFIRYLKAKYNNIELHYPGNIYRDNIDNKQD